MAQIIETLSNSVVVRRNQKNHSTLLFQIQCFALFFCPVVHKQRHWGDFYPLLLAEIKIKMIGRSQQSSFSQSSLQAKLTGKQGRHVTCFYWPVASLPSEPCDHYMAVTHVSKVAHQRISTFLFSIQVLQQYFSKLVTFYLLKNVEKKR